MTTTTFPDLPPKLPTTADNAAADALFYRDSLNELVELGMGLARRMAAVPVVDGPEVACIVSAAFEQVSRAVRRTIRLAQFLAQPVKTRPVVDAAVRRAEARERIARRVEDHLEWSAHVGKDVDGLHEELLERLDGLDVIEAIDRDRPVDELVQEIIGDLGLAGKQFRRRRPADVAALRAWSAAGQMPDAGCQTPEGGAGAGAGTGKVGAHHDWVTAESLRAGVPGLAGWGGDTS